MDGFDAGAHRGARFHAAALAIAALLAIAETWPLATRLATHVPQQRHPATGEAYPGAKPDQLYTAWILASDARRLGADPLAVFETNNQHPFRRTLAHSENLLGLAVVVWPAQALWDDPVLTNNLALLVALAGSAYGVILLVHELGRSMGAAVAAAALATYAPFVWANIDQLHVVAGPGVALAWFAVVRLVRTRRWRWAAALGVLAAWQAWASLHWGVFLGLGLASGVPVLLATSAEARRAFPQFAFAGALALALVVPLARPYLAVSRDMDLLERGAPVFLYLPWLVFPPFSTPLAHLGERLARGVRHNATMTLAPWIAMAAGLAASAVVRRPRFLPAPVLAALAASAAVTFWYACGPVSWFGVPSLYTALSAVPGLGVVRGPARAVAYTSLMLAVLAGCGLAAVLRRLPGPAGWAVAAFVIAIGIVEAGWRPGDVVAAPARDPAVAAAITALPAGCAIAELPDDFGRQAHALFRSTAHWRPLVNGRSGFYPVSTFVEAGFLNQFPAEPAVAYLAAAGACAVVVHTDTPAGRIMAQRARERGLPQRALTGTETLVRVPAPPAPQPLGPSVPRDGWHALAPDGAAALDGSLETLAEFPVGSAEPLARLTVDLGRPTSVAAVTLALGRHFRRYLWTYRVEGSLDGTRWTTLAESPASLPPLAAYRTDPARLVQEIRVAPAVARFLRIGPARPAPAGDVIAMDAGFARWGVAELEVYAPPGGEPPC